jgi:hypothetical protein
MKLNYFYSFLMRKAVYKRTGQTYTEEDGFLSRTISNHHLMLRVTSMEGRVVGENTIVLVTVTIEA